MKTIDIIAGARPNFMKIAPIINALKAAQLQDDALYYRLIHAGQHYDKAMSCGFCKRSTVSGKPAASLPPPSPVSRMPASTTQMEQAKWMASSDGVWAARHGRSCSAARGQR